MKHNRPAPIAHRASPIAHRPSPIAHRPWPIAHRPSALCPARFWALEFRFRVRKCEMTRSRIERPFLKRAVTRSIISYPARAQLAGARVASPSGKGRGLNPRECHLGLFPSSKVTEKQPWSSLTWPFLFCDPSVRLQRRFLLASLI